MAKKSKLLLALDAHKGRDYDAEKRKKQIKAAEKTRAKSMEAHEDDEDAGQKAKSTLQKISDSQEEVQESTNLSVDEDGWEDEDDRLNGVTLTANGALPELQQDPSSPSEAEADSDVPVSDLSEDDRADTIQHQRMTINNGPALLASTKSIAIVKPGMAFSIHNSLISTLPAASTSIPDPNDDLTRELEFYRIAQDAAITARDLLKKEKIPFSRPPDYFAEMVKSDEHMSKVKKKMYDEAAGKKASSEAKAQREAKKFGKQVQRAKEEERARAKKETLEKIKDLKRKRKGQDTGLTNEPDDLFQSISVEDPSSNPRDRKGRSDGPRNGKRQKRESKFGFGGKKRYSKSGDAVSSADMSGFSAGRMKGRNGAAPGPRKVKAQRLGKSRRAAASR